MYKGILEGIFESNGVRTEAEKIAYLQGLKPDMNKLFDAFRSNAIKVDYGNENIQSCYLIRYFPIYTQPIIDVMKKIKEGGRMIRMSSADLVRLVFIGPGPCPEVVGLLTIINSYKKNINYEICLIDKYIDSWGYSRAIAYDKLILAIPDSGNIALETCEDDFMDANFYSRHLDKFGNSDIVVFQFCLNETQPNRYQDVITNLAKIVAGLKDDRMLVIIERLGYDAMVNLIKNLEKYVVEKDIAEVLFSIDHQAYEPQYHDIVNDIPSVITDNLLDGVGWSNANGRIPSRKVSYRFSAIKKKKAVE
ncbi:hypothetical protein [Hymenobacter psychrophilus]|uniref:Uncharacterized protein n=1 Tax=Hymenobacter psychrophilus TaxID=651662 RepID=A0A1H3EWQ5_9BACT|nr:hypothetical protein [Hymenobacter psychrophilus]SDX83212.1 hypothetical protein SAMN04488069_103339 [Hymenobacter psychrophilus]